jgi:peptidoglycan/LPS O-acetylase OafA/YrhL
MSSKIYQLESLRGIAAVMVVLYHCAGRAKFEIAFANNFYLFVDFFFVLSGFVIALNYSGKIDTKNDFFDFQFKRFLRLYPLHFAMLVVFLFLEIFKYNNIGGE